MLSTNGSSPSSVSETKGGACLACPFVAIICGNSLCCTHRPGHTLGVECVEQRSAQIEGVDTVKLKRDYRLKDKPLKTLSLFEKMERAKKEMERETAAPLDMKLPADASPAAGVTRGGAARPKTPSTDDPGGSLLEQLGAIAGCGTSAAENAGAPGSHEPEIHIAGLTTKSDGAVAAKSGLIEVVVRPSPLCVPCLLLRVLVCPSRGHFLVHTH